MKNPVPEDDPELNLRLQALTILMCDKPRAVPNAEEIAKRLDSLPERMPVRDAERRYANPVEERDGVWYVAGYSGKKHQWNADEASCEEPHYAALCRKCGSKNSRQK